MTKNTWVFLRNGRKHNEPVNEIHSDGLDILASEEWP